MKTNKKDKGLASGIFLAYSILVFHALLIGLLFILIIFFRGIVNNLLQIMIIGIIITILSAYFFYKKIKKNSGQLKDILNDPAFKGRNLEISFMGGIASLKIGLPVEYNNALEYSSKEPLQIEDLKTIRLRELKNIAEIYEKGLISKQEYQKLKDEIINNDVKSSVD